MSENVRVHIFQMLKYAQICLLFIHANHPENLCLQRCSKRTRDLEEKRRTLQQLESRCQEERNELDRMSALLVTRQGKLEQLDNAHLPRIQALQTDILRRSAYFFYSIIPFSYPFTPHHLLRLSAVTSPPLSFH